MTDTPRAPWLIFLSRRQWFRSLWHFLSSRHHALVFLSAVLIVVSFPPFNFYPLLFVALVPWFWALSHSNSRSERFFCGLFLGFYMTLGGFYWVATVLNEFGELPWFFAILGLLFFALGNQPQFLVMSLAYPKLRSQKYFAALYATLYTAVDWAVPKLFLDTFGHALWKASWLRQGADIVGVFGLTWVIVFVQVSISPQLGAWFAGRFKGRIQWKVLLPAGAVLSALALYGAFRTQQIEAKVANSNKTIRAAVVQPNIGDVEKIASHKGLRAATRAVTSELIRLSTEGAHQTPKPDFVVWPETAFPSAFRHPETATELENERALDLFIKSNQIPLVFGGYDSDKGKDFNALFVLSPFRDPGLSGRDNVQTYQKHVLLMFGEYIPGAETFDIIKQSFPKVGNFGRGPGPQSIPISLSSDAGSPRLLNISPLICYEALFSWFSLESKKKGGEVLLNVTNDSWFGSYGEPYLHLSLVTFRSVESRLPQLRATNTGITTLVDALGNTLDPTPLDTALVRTYSISTTAPIYSPIDTLGDSAGPICGILLLLIFALRRLFRTFQRR